MQRRDDARPPHALTLGEADQPGLGALGGGAAAAGEVRCQVPGVRSQVTCTWPGLRHLGEMCRVIQQLMPAPALSLATQSCSPGSAATRPAGAASGP